MQSTNDHNNKPNAVTRIPLLDVLRGIAIIAMTIFHFSWDLEFYGYAPAGMTSQIEWKMFARTIAASFLMIAGFSLMLAHSGGIVWPVFRRRFAMLFCAALIISLATYFTTPERFVFFGILHQITVASLIGLIVLRLPAMLILILGIGFLLLPHFFRHAFFDQTFLWWTGLAPFDPPSNDYVPVFPWTGWMLIGMALAKYCIGKNLLRRFATVQTKSHFVQDGLRFLGRNSLIYYLIHQPLMMATFYTLTLITPPAPIDKAALFVTQCVQGCERDKPFCKRFCGCVRQKLEAGLMFQDVLDNNRDVAQDPEILEISSMCSNEALQ